MPIQNKCSRYYRLELEMDLNFPTVGVALTFYRGPQNSRMIRHNRMLNDLQGSRMPSGCVFYLQVVKNKCILCQIKRNTSDTYYPGKGTKLRKIVLNQNWRSQSGMNSRGNSSVIFGKWYVLSENSLRTSQGLLNEPPVSRKWPELHSKKPLRAEAFLSK